jgi:signal transduction histidine kinase
MGDPDLSEDQRTVLDVLVSQAAVALGTTMLCVDRTQRLAVEQERNRIARDIHDTVAQSLFGVVFSLDACISILPGDPNRVRQELLELRDLASGVRDEVRNSIFDLWPSELTLARFQDDLHNYASSCCRPQEFNVEFTTQGDFDRLSPMIRRSLYRVAQEALANAARHSGANTARVALRAENDRVHLCVEDHGRGFDTQKALAREGEHERFGLHGIQERIRSLGGRVTITSEIGQGTRLMVQVPTEGGA